MKRICFALVLAALALSAQAQTNDAPRYDAELAASLGGNLHKA